MAFVPIQQKQLQDLTENGGGAITTSAGSTTGTGPQNSAAVTQAMATPGTAPSQFVNFQDMIDANSAATTDYAKQVGSLIGYDDSANQLNTTNTQAIGDINAGYNDVDESVVDQVLANPSNRNFEGYSKLQQLLGGGGYTGPQNAQEIYQGAKQSVDSLADKSGGLNDISSLKSFILQKPNVGTTVGGASLDAALLANTQGSQQEIGNVQQRVADLQKQYQDSVAGAQQTIAQKNADAAARRNAIVGKANSTIGGIQGENNAELAALQAQEQAKAQSAATAAQAGDFATLKSLIPGLDDSQISNILSQLKNKDSNFSNYASISGPQLTTGNVLSQDEVNRYQGIRDAFGLGADDFIKAAGSGTQVGFDNQRLLADLNARLSTQVFQEQQAAQFAATQAAAQQAAQTAYQNSRQAGQTQAAATLAAQTAWTDAGGDASGDGSGAASAGDSADGSAGVGVGEGGIGSSGAGTAAGDAAGNSEGSGGAADGSGTAGDSAGGGGGGGGKIICTAMADFYGLPYRDNKIWMAYAKRNLTPAHEKGYHKVFLPLVDYGFKQGDGLTHKVMRSALIWIGKNRTSDIKNELAGKPRNALHKFLRAVIEPALGFIGRRVK